MGNGEQPFHLAPWRLSGAEVFMNPYATPNESKVGPRRPKIQHLASDPNHPRTRRDRLAEKQGVAAERRAIKKSARQFLKQEMISELENGD